MTFLLFALGFSFLMVGVVSTTIAKNISGFVSANTTTTVTDTDGVLANPTIPAAQPGTLTVRTSGTVGSLTMTNTGHGITTGQRVDLYWAGGHCYGAVVGTVSGTTVPIASVSGGSALPAASTAITVGICTSAPFSLTGNNLSLLLGVAGAANGYFVWNDGTNDLNPQYVTSADAYEWDVNTGGASPLASDTPTKVWISHDDTAGSHQDFKAVAQYH